MTNEELAKALADASQAARIAASNFAPTSKIAIVGNVTAGLLALGSRIARGGSDPVAHITRLVNLSAMMSDAKSEVDAEADAKFGPAPPPGAPPPAGEAVDEQWPDEPTKTEGRGSAPPAQGTGS